MNRIFNPWSYNPPKECYKCGSFDVPVSKLSIMQICYNSSGIKSPIEVKLANLHTFGYSTRGYKVFYKKIRIQIHKLKKKIEKSIIIFLNISVPDYLSVMK